MADSPSELTSTNGTLPGKCHSSSTLDAKLSTSECDKTTTNGSETNAKPPAVVHVEEPDPAAVHVEEPDPVVVHVEEPDPAVVHVEEPDPAVVHVEEPDPAVVHVEKPYLSVVHGDDQDSSKSTDEKSSSKRSAVGIWEVFSYATVRDKVLMCLGLVCSCLHGCAMPLMLVNIGEMLDKFAYTAWVENQLDDYVADMLQTCINATSNDTRCYGLTRETLLQDPDSFKSVVSLLSITSPSLERAIKYSGIDFGGMSEFAIYFAILGGAVFVLAYGQTFFCERAAISQVQRIRASLFKAVLRQEISWFDTHASGEIHSRLVDDIAQIESGIGEKLALFFLWISRCIACYVISFVYGWKLTLVMISVCPVVIICGIALSKLGSRFTVKELQAYAKAGAIAEEVIGAIRTVVAFSGETKEAERYKVNLGQARRLGHAKGVMTGVSFGFSVFVVFTSYALAFWYGSSLVRSAEITAGDLIIVLACVVLAGFALGFAAPYWLEFSNARGAAYKVYNIISQVPAIDSSSTAGTKLSSVRGRLALTNVNFRYPNREAIQVLKGTNFEVDVGHTAALVGESGCGKSTIIQLLQRFYDTDSGQVRLDGHDICELNVKWFRQQIGVVSQEPVLFGCTIAQNISYGRDDATTADVIRAAKQANAHDFIMDLPQEYETLVGERGAQLSGGQKQRIAIARALVRDPKILLLDEATSALDTESEKTVQDALDQARLGRTTLIVAHRLSTVRTADVIIGIQDGRVAEMGTHEDLMKTGGVYWHLANAQEEELSDVGETVNGVHTKVYTSEGKHERPIASSGPTSRGVSSSATETQGKLPKGIVKRLMKLNSPEAGYIVVGVIAAIVTGAIQPFYAVLFAEIIKVLSQPSMETMTSETDRLSGLIAGIGIVTGLSVLLKFTMIARSGEGLTERLRGLAFTAILRQEIAFFDDHENSTGALCARLADDSSAIQGATGFRLATYVQAVATLGAAFVIGFIFSWELTLLALAFVPPLILTGAIGQREMTGRTRGDRKANEASGKIAVEAIQNIRTVATLTKEDTLLQEFCDATRIPYKHNLRSIHLSGFTAGLAQSILYFANAALYYLAAYLIDNRGMPYYDAFRVTMVIIVAAQSTGTIASFAPDQGKAVVAAENIFALLDREPSIDSFSEAGETMETVAGSVELSSVHFAYPSRPDVEVLRSVDLLVEPGHRVALVGSSGCGKSTVVQLLERFYAPHSGALKLDGKNLEGFNLKWLRSQMGIVSQEPVLFATSIRDNISYGDNSRDVDMDKVISAARDANIHDFITSLPEGYETNVGEKGTQLSGGQKQRVAIARALVRNPKILLLDEATSALDTESEKVVQEALDKAQEGRTCIVIAHRLSTIRNADTIVVIHNGRVAETGTHSELISLRGIYYKLNITQEMSDTEAISASTCL